MLATLPSQPPSLTVAGFVYEPKYDGIRAIVEVVPGPGKAGVRLWSRNGNEKTAQFPDIVDAVGEWGRGLPGAVVLDGEVTALDAERQAHRLSAAAASHSRQRAWLPLEQGATVAGRTAGGPDRVRLAARR